MLDAGTRRRIPRMKEQFADIGTPAGAMKTFIVHPEQHGPFPAVILYLDFWGVRDELYDIARWVATVGYCCAVPDLYYRQGTILNDIRNKDGRTVSLNRLDEATRAKVLAPLQKLSDAEAMDDTAALLRFLEGYQHVRGGAKGCFGFCLGGRLALRAAAHFPETLKAAASLHGTRLVSEDEDSPHRAVRKIQGEVYCGFGANDPFTPPATVAGLAAAMKAAGIPYTYTVHASTEHGYALPDRDVYNKQAVLRDWELILAMFHRQIPTYHA
jgi:carboxymethylenebutenolidase